MIIKCDKCGRNYEVGKGCVDETIECQCGAKIVVSLPEEFAVPAIAKWIYGIGQVIVAFGFGFTACFVVRGLYESKGWFYTAVLSGSVSLGGLIIMGFGKALEYLAEIAFNTRTN